MGKDTQGTMIELCDKKEFAEAPTDTAGDGEEEDGER